MISGTFKAGVQTLKPGDLVRETSSLTGFVGDYVVLNAKIFPVTGNTVYKLITVYAKTGVRLTKSVVKPGQTTFITEDELFEGKSVQWSIR